MNFRECSVGHATAPLHEFGEDQARRRRPFLGFRRGGGRDEDKWRPDHPDFGLPLSAIQTMASVWFC